MIVVKTEMVGNFKIRICQDEDPMNPREWENIGHIVCWHSRYNLGDEHRKDSQEEFLQELAETVDESISERILYWEDGNGYQKIFNDCAREFPDTNWMDRPTSDRINKKVMAIIYKTIHEHYIMLPLYLYEHGGITMSTGSFSCVFDSGQVGWIYVTKEKIREEYGWKVLTKKRIETIEGYFKAEIETYDRFISGQVYGFIVTEHGTCKHCGAAMEADAESSWGHFMDPDDLLEEAKAEVKNYTSELDCECSKYHELLSAINQEKGLFNMAEIDRGEPAFLASRLDSRMGGTM